MGVVVYVLQSTREICCFMKYLLYFIGFWEGAVQLYNEGPLISLNSYSIPDSGYRFLHVYQDQIME